MKTPPEAISLPSHLKSIAGVRSGKLVARYPVGRRANGDILWHCECDCGGFRTTNASNIRYEHLTSCGCEKRKISVIIGEGTEIQQVDSSSLVDPIPLSPKARDITDVRSGKLVARYPVAKSANKHLLWYCTCDCGNTKVTYASCIISKFSTSCGCANAEKYKINGHVLKNMKRPPTIIVDGLSFIVDNEINGYKHLDNNYKICKERGRWQVYGLDEDKEYELFKDAKLEKAVKRIAAIEKNIRESGATSRYPIFKMIEQGF